MIHDYKGNYIYDQKIIEDWNSTVIGVYYCGYVSDSTLYPYYIGKGTGDGGIRARLMDHLRVDDWPDVTHFGYRICDTAKEAGQYELQEIERCKPKYNTQGM